jgi:tetratricopeptide (TPR) repeat protein
MKTMPYLTALCRAISFFAICAGFVHFGLKTCPAAEIREVAAAYVEGIESLEGGDFQKAANDFTGALNSDNDNGDYVRARGVASVLAENFPAAITDLERALRLRRDDAEA